MDAKFLFFPFGLLPTVFQEWFFPFFYLKDVYRYLREFLRGKSPPADDVEMPQAQ